MTTYSGRSFSMRVDVLIDRVGRALVPLLVDPLLRRHDVDELAQLAAEELPPAEVDVPVEAHRLVLREHQHLPQAAVQAVGQREIDDPIHPAERHGRLARSRVSGSSRVPLPPARTTVSTLRIVYGSPFSLKCIHAPPLRLTARIVKGSIVSARRERA